MVRPSGLKATLRPACVCPARVRTGLLSAASHTRMVLSTQPEAMVRPSGLKATLSTGIVYQFCSSVSTRTSGCSVGTAEAGGGQGSRNANRMNRDACMNSPYGLLKMFPHAAERFLDCRAVVWTRWKPGQRGRARQSILQTASFQLQRRKRQGPQKN